MKIDRKVHLKLVLPVVLFAMLLTCQSSEQDVLVASFRGGTIALSEVEHVLLRTPEGSHVKNLESLLQNYQEVARELTLTKLLAQAEAGKQPESPLAQMRYRDSAAEGFRQRFGKPLPPIEMTDIEAYYLENSTEFSQPARRHIRNLFIPNRDNGQRVANLEEIKDLFFRGQGGDSLKKRFATLNLTVLNSLEGWRNQGDLPLKWDRLIFSRGLADRDAIQTANGTLLINTIQAVDAALLPLAQVESQIRARLSQQAQQHQLESLGDLIAWPAETVILQREPFDVSIGAGNPAAPMFKMETLELKLAEFLDWAAQEGRLTTDHADLWLFYRELIEKQRLFLQMEHLGFDQLAPPSNQHIKTSQAPGFKNSTATQLDRNILIDLKRNQKALRAFCKQRPELLQADARFRVNIFVISDLEEEHFIEVSVQMQRFRQMLQNTSPRELVNQPKAILTKRSDWLTADQFAGMMPGLVAELEALQGPGLIGPVLVDARLVLIQVDGIEPAQTLTFENALDQIAQAYLEENHLYLVEKYKSERLAEANFIFHRERLLQEYQQSMSKTTSQE